MNCAAAWTLFDARSQAPASALRAELRGAVVDPRLAEFLKHPGIEVRLAAGTDYTRFNADEFDADIVYGPPRVEGLIVVPLGEETITPLCAPDLAATIATPSDLLDHVLIQSDSKQIQWADWFAANGLLAPPPNGSRFDRSFLAIAAAAEGLGVALESTRLAEQSSHGPAGHTVGPEGDPDPLRRAQPDFPRYVRQRHHLRAFAEWLLANSGSRRRRSPLPEAELARSEFDRALANICDAKADRLCQWRVLFACASLRFPA